MCESANNPCEISSASPKRFQGVRAARQAQIKLRKQKAPIGDFLEQGVAENLRQDQPDHKRRVLPIVVERDLPGVDQSSDQVDDLRRAPEAKRIEDAEGNVACDQAHVIEAQSAEAQNDQHDQQGDKDQISDQRASQQPARRRC